MAVNRLRVCLTEAVVAVTERWLLKSHRSLRHWMTDGPLHLQKTVQLRRTGRGKSVGALTILAIVMPHVTPTLLLL